MATKKLKASTGKKQSRRAEAKRKEPAGCPGHKAKIRQALVDLVLGAGQEIVQNVINAAKTGNYLPAKYLFEFAGIAEALPEADDAAMARVKSLTEILLENMREQTPAE